VIPVGPEAASEQGTATNFALDAPIAAINRFTVLTIAQLREVKTDVEIAQRVHINRYSA
jgi:hypothetical protein